jgi:AcrR family transcriptional regulator
MRVTAETKTVTRQRILEAAQEHFASQGFQQATTRDIARAAGLGVGTLFNYFPTKEAIALALVSAANEAAAARFEADRAKRGAEPLTLEEELFAHIAAVLRKLKPYRKYLAAVLDTQLSPLVDRGEASFQAAHLEVVSQIAARHGQGDALSSVALHLYWTLYVGALSFWSQDASPKQEDTLALLDQSLAMFCAWLATQSPDQWSRDGSAGASPSRGASPSQNTGDLPCQPSPN